MYYKNVLTHCFYLSRVKAVYQAQVMEGIYMNLYNCKTLQGLTDDEKAAAINLAFTLELNSYDSKILAEISEKLSEIEKFKLCDFWLNLTETTARAAFCLLEFEGRLWKN